MSSVHSSPDNTETTTLESKSNDEDVSESTVTEATTLAVTEEAIVYFDEITTESIILSTIETFTLREEVVVSVGKYK